MNDHDRGERLDHVLRIPVDCDACAAAPGATPGKEVHAAGWAIVLRICCRNGDRAARFMCHEHFEQIVSAEFPYRCALCGRSHRSVADVMDSAITLQVGR